MVGSPVSWGSPRTAVGNTIVSFVVIAVIVAASVAVVAMRGPFNSPDSVTSTASSALVSPATFLVRVVDQSGVAPMAGATVVAAPIPSPNDVALTPGGPSINECVHQVPNGAYVYGNGTVVAGTTTFTISPCPLKVYTSNSTGWVSINNATGVWYFIKAGNVNEWNYVVIGVMPGTTVNMALPLPSGNATVPSSEESCVTGNGGNITSTCTKVPGLPVFEPPTTIVWPCGLGLPNGSAGTAQGFYGGYYIAYSYAALPNGTKAALLNDCNVGGL